MKIIQQTFFFIIYLFLTISNAISQQQIFATKLQTDLLGTSVKSLDLSQLPESLKREQTNRFEDLASSAAIKFNFYGNEDYGICNVDQKRMVNHIALRATPANCEFYILDIGAGDGSFGKSIYKYVNSEEFKDFLEKQKITKNIKFHIVSLTAEPMGSTIQISENGIHYYVTKFMAENLSESIKTINSMDFYWDWGPTFGEAFFFIKYRLTNTENMKEQFNSKDNIKKYRVEREILEQFKYLFNNYIESNDEISFMIGIENLLDIYFASEKKVEKEQIITRIREYINNPKNMNTIFYYKEVIRKNIDKIRTLHNKVDWIVSNYCFIHLVDPLGMLKQGFDILRPQDGIMTIDDLAVSVDDANVELGRGINDSREFNRKNLVICLLKSGEPFIIGRGRDFWNVMIKRSSEKQLHLPVKYKENAAYAKIRHAEGGLIATYEWADKQPLVFTIIPYLREAEIYSDTISGSAQEFYHEYQDVFSANIIKWTSLNSDKNADDALNFRFIEPMTTEENYLTIKESEWKRICIPYNEAQFQGILPSHFAEKITLPYYYYYNFRYAKALSEKNYKEILFILDDILLNDDNKKLRLKRKIHYFQKPILENLDTLEMLAEDNDHKVIYQLPKDFNALCSLLHKEAENTKESKTSNEFWTHKRDYEGRLAELIKQINPLLKKHSMKLINSEDKKVELSSLLDEIELDCQYNEKKAQERNKIDELKNKYQKILKPENIE